MVHIASRWIQLVCNCTAVSEKVCTERALAYLLLFGLALDGEELVL